MSPDQTSAGTTRAVPPDQPPRVPTKASTRRSHRARRAGAAKLAPLLALVVACAAGYGVWRAADGQSASSAVAAETDGASAGRTTADASPARDLPQLVPAKPQPIAAFQVRDLAGRQVPIVPAGEPGVIMINSKTCGYCKKALADLGRYAKGRPVPRLRVLTLEGAEAGVEGLEREGITGAALLGPLNSVSEIMTAFRYQGTPTFIAVDREGRPVVSMPGYPGADALVPWFDVMLGDREVN